LVAAFRRARGEGASHSVAQALRLAFRFRCRRIRAYLSAGRVKAGARAVVVALRGSFADIAEAFRQHGRAFHAASHLGLA